MKPVETLAEDLRKICGDRYSVAAMESCTGGLFGSALTDVPGSGYLLASAVCYDIGAKVACGVPRELIERHGVVSREVAEAMALAAATFFDADIGLSTTGVAGPDAEDGIEPGTVWVGLRLPSGEVFASLLRLHGDRQAVKAEAVRRACELLLAQLEDKRIVDPAQIH